MSTPLYDTAELIAVRSIVRDAYARIDALRPKEATSRCVSTDLKEMAHDLNVAIESQEPELPFRKVVPSVPATQNTGHPFGSGHTVRNW